ncbi:hypothetical protein ACFZAV_45695, partial [Streptomyces sp. NPDC008343]|uniref:hypothetical protein n=1 Tax=Streptomyces sp. NPDC008343 TaxID=3364828 RepID=UPI0036E474E6
NKIVTRRTSDGYTSIESFDALGRTVTVQDNYHPDTGKLTNSDSDGDGLRTLSAQHYNQAGQVDTTTDTAGRETHLAYNTLGRLKSTTTPDGITTTYTTDPVQATTTTSVFAKDAKNPASTVTETHNDQCQVVSSTTTYGDNTPGQKTDSHYNALGQVTKDSGFGIGTTDHTYTPGGAPETDTVRNGTNESPDVASYSVDGFGRQTGKVLERGGEKVQGDGLEFDAAGRLKVSTDAGGGRTVSAFDGDGRLESVTRANGDVTHYQYESATGRLQETWVSPKGEPDAKRQHTRTEFDPVTGQASKVYDPARREATEIVYAYYPDGAVKSTTYPGGKKVSYEYTKDGRIRTLTDVTGAVTSYHYSEDGTLHEVVQKDSAGRTLASVTYGYDAMGRLEKVDR